MFANNYPLLELLNAVTGWDMDTKKALETGARIQTLRQCFNLREGIKPSGINLPARMVGLPPKDDGPLAGVTIDIQSLAHEYRKALGWDPDNGYPSDATLERLGLKTLMENHGGGSS